MMGPAQFDEKYAHLITNCDVIMAWLGKRKLKPGNIEITKE